MHRIVRLAPLLFAAVICAAGSSNAGPSPGSDDGFEREGSGERRAALDRMEGSAPPALVVEGWLNSEPLTLADLGGKVVVIDFWATWCPPCRAAIPKLVALHERLGAQGLVVIGVHDQRKAETMPAFVRENGIPYAVAADATGATMAAFRPDALPDYYLIDRAGRLRFADLANHELERAVEALVAEEAGAATSRGPDLAALARAWPESVYDLVQRGKVIGSTTLRNRLLPPTEERPEPTFEMEDLRVQRTTGMEIQMRFVARTAAGDLRALQRLHAWAGKDESTNALDLRFEGGVMSGTRATRTVVREVPERLVTEYGLIRLMALSRREAGATVTVDLFDTSRVKVVPGVKVTCIGPEAAGLDGESVPCWRYTSDLGRGAPSDFWFDDERRLVRARWGGAEEWRRAAPRAEDAEDER